MAEFEFLDRLFRRRRSYVEEPAWVHRAAWALHVAPRAGPDAAVGTRWAQRQAERVEQTARRIGLLSAQRLLADVLAVVDRHQDGNEQAACLYVLLRHLGTLPPAAARLVDACALHATKRLHAQDGAASVEWLRLRGWLSRWRGARSASRQEPSGALERGNVALAGWLHVPDDMPALTHAAREYLAADQPALADNCLVRAEALGGTAVAETAPLRGKCAFLRDDHEAAAAHFYRAVQAGCDEHEIAVWQATALVELRRYEEARHFVERLPDPAVHPDMRVLAGTIALGCDDLALGRTWLQSVPADDAQADAARYGLGVCAALIGDAPAAQAAFRDLERAGSPLAPLGLGLLASEQGEPGAAAAALEAALRHWPRHRAARLRLGESRYAQGLHAEAEANLAEARASGAGGGTLDVRLALSRLATGRLEPAFEGLAAHCKRGDEPDLSAHAAACAGRLADRAIAAGDHAAAVHILEGVEGSAASPALQRDLALALYEQGRALLGAGGASDEAFALLRRSGEVCDTPESALARMLAGVAAGEEAPEDGLGAGTTLAEQRFRALLRLVLHYRAGRFDDLVTLLDSLPPLDPPYVQAAAAVAFHVDVRRREAGAAVDPKRTEAFLAAMADGQFHPILATQPTAWCRLAVALLWHSQDARKPRPAVLRKQVETLCTDSRLATLWRPALGLAHLLCASRMPSKLGELRAARAALEAPPMAAGSSEWLALVRRAEICELLADEQFEAALPLLACELVGAPAHGALHRLHAELQKQLASATPQAAELALKSGKHEQARTIWAALAGAGDAGAAHRLAASLLAQALDVAAGDAARARVLAARCLPYWHQTASNDAYWAHLIDRLRGLGSNLYPFQEASVTAARAAIGEQVLTVLSRLAEQFARRGDVEQASACVESITSSPFGIAAGRAVLETDFAPRLLGAASLADADDASCERALASAELVLACDGANFAASTKAIAACNAQMELPEADKSIRWIVVAERFRRCVRLLHPLLTDTAQSAPERAFTIQSFWRNFARALEWAVSDCIGVLNRSEGRDDSQRDVIRELVDAYFTLVEPQCRNWQAESDAPYMKKSGDDLARNGRPGRQGSRQWLDRETGRSRATPHDASFAATFSVFGRSGPNPFRVNAFSMVGVSSGEFVRSELRDRLRARRVEIEHGSEPLWVDAGGGRRVTLGLHDINASEEVLLDPNRRCLEQLLVPEPADLAALAGLQEFQAEHRLTAAAVEALFGLEPLDLSQALVHALPAAEFGPRHASRPLPPFPTLAPQPLAPGDWLATRKDRDDAALAH